MHVCMYVCMYVCVYVHVHVYVYVYVYIYPCLGNLFLVPKSSNLSEHNILRIKQEYKAPYMQER